MSQRRRLSLFLLLSITLTCHHRGPHNCPGAVWRAQEADDPVVAVVGDERVYKSEVDWLFQRKLAQRVIDPKVEELMRAQILKQLVDQQLVLDFLREHDALASPDEIRLAIDQIAERASGVGKTLNEFLTEQKLTRRAIERNLMWQMSWGKYTSEHLTDDKLEKFFQQRHRLFDGTELRVSHLLVKADAPPHAEPWKMAREKLRTLRDQITTGNITWEQAVSEHSDAPTAASGGDIGWIRIDGPMPVVFSEAAFGLEQGEVTDPVTTSFGVHLIKCMEVRPGSIRWYEIRPALRRAVVEALFEKISGDKRPSAEIQHRGIVPYIDPKTGELVPASPSESSEKKR